MFGARDENHLGEKL